jgi:hypothetical protein
MSTSLELQAQIVKAPLRILTHLLHKHSIFIKQPQDVKIMKHATEKTSYEQYKQEY